MDSFYSKRPSLQTVVTAAFIVSGIVVSILILTVLYQNVKLGLRTELKNRLTSITNIAALQQDGDILLKVSARDDEYYKIINERNLAIRDSDPDLVFVYTMRKNKQGIYFVVDANRPGDQDISDFGEQYNEPGPTLVENFDTIGKTIIEPDFYTDEYGTFISAYAPVYTSAGEKAGVLGIDIAADRVVARERDFLSKSLLLFAASLPIILLIGYLLGKFVTAPLQRLTSTALKIAEGNLKERADIPTSSREVALLAVTFNQMAKEISNLVTSLELRVQDRTAELEKRASQLQSVSGLARTFESIQDLEALLPRITRLVGEQFGYYHTGIFLIDDENKFAILRSANSEGARRMLDRKHKLRLDTTTPIGYAIIRGEPRIALDTGPDSVHFNEPALPKTRSQMALPLRVGEHIIGALDIHSSEQNAFFQEDLSIAVTLADQIAIAIENARLFGESQNALVESRTIIGKYVKQEWESYANQIGQAGYVFDGKQVLSVDEKKQMTKLKAIAQTGSLSLEKTPSNITMPIKLRGQTIGILDVRHQKGQREWTQDEIALLEAAAERTALALENARLVESAQRRASRERVIGEISTKINAFSDMDAILQSAVEELGRKISGTAEVIIELGEEDTQGIL